MLTWTVFLLIFGSIVVMNLILMGMYIWTYIRVKKTNMSYIKNVVAIMIFYTIATTTEYVSIGGIMLSPQIWRDKTEEDDTVIPIVSYSI